MKKSTIYPYKIFYSLGLLEEKDIKHFVQWLNSPWCNSQRALAPLFRALSSYYPDFNASDLNLPRLYKKLYRGKAYHHRSMLNLLSDLSREVVRFLKHQQLMKRPRIQEALLREVFQNRGKITNEMDSLRKEIDRIALTTIYSDEEHLQAFKLNSAWAWRAALLGKSNNRNTELYQAQLHLDTHYLLNKLRYWVEQIESQQEENRQEAIFQQVQGIQQQLPHLLDHPTVRWYLTYLEEKRLRLQRQVSGESSLDPTNLWAFFSHLLNQYEKDFNTIETMDQRIILLLLINETARLKLLGIQASLKTSLYLYQFGLRENILLYLGRITPHTYANILAAAVGLKDFVYAKSFVRNNTNCLQTNFRSAAYLWAKTTIAYQEDAPELPQLLEKLQRQKRTSITSFSLRIRLLINQIRFDAYWQGRDTLNDEFWKSNEAFARKLRRQKDYPTKHIKALQGFTKYLQLLANLLPVTRSNRTEFIQLKTNFEQDTRWIHAKDWLHERFEILAKD